MESRISYFEDASISAIAIPERFTFPFYYEPHPLTKIAAGELQHYLETHTALDHNFGLDADKDGAVIGKMFGILVVADTHGKLGYLSAFSGKLAGTNDHPKFVPPVFDMLVEDSFFLKGVEIINNINARIKELVPDLDYQRLKTDTTTAAATALQEINALKLQLKANKTQRGQQRDKLKNSLNEADYAIAAAALINQSLEDKRQLKQLTLKWDTALAALRSQLAAYEETIEALKNERKERSADLQRQLFEQYSFLNKDGKSKSLQEIFSQTVFGKPPAGAGECAMPKLLQYAFAHHYQPLAIAEFWWGDSPKSEIRKHKQFYPACTGKCKPILEHMLEGIPLDENPLLRTPEKDSQLEIVYEDDSLVVVNKPFGLRSVPGVNIADSVYHRLKQTWDIEPLMIHRLDMDTSGLLVVAKTPAVHKHIQRQFLKRTVSKRYTALLSKVIAGTTGEIDLPLCADLLNRPRQLVSFTEGKKAVTKWEVVARNEQTTKIHFWPLTGRTHQLRMHAAHESGLNAAIVGDDLYGTAADRMYLHAAQLSFMHPVTRETIKFEIPDGF